MADNPFIVPKPNKLDINFWGLTTVILILFVIGYLLSNTLQNPGIIYFFLTSIIYIFVFFALTSHFNIGSWVIFGRTVDLQNFLLDAGIGVALALALNLGVFAVTGYSISIPLVIASTASTTGVGPTLQYTILSVYGPLIEEVFWIGVFVPTYARFLRGTAAYAVTGILLVSSLIVLFLGSQYIGSWAIAVAVGLLVLDVILQSKVFFTKLDKQALSQFPGALLLGALIITALHVYAYGNLFQNLPLFIGAFLFFIIEGILDYFRGSIVPSIMAHTVNNAIVGYTALGSTLGASSIIIFGIVLFMFLYLLFIFRLRESYVRLLNYAPGKFVRSNKGAY
jgi:hypothetical protein